ncbi:cytochrome d ubiquinol oxidase subunit II [Cryptosporangium aurantiacum]|uniref:Cytochrome bd-I ubiquinol oxidase subunit 2 apoprotein n=1 Tax=Cryptosporangium aurantiacum TaxID=134849 RepID=A0A1M7QLY0_9ACTN|nr:cytochrome d ubiquinol oxidase subunit II [Cryptosporangium aurantiacum]SHN32288.1 cytochrome bd-I ubiquinol oxidase subunit 2 apoprotein [Cryptosporangium aurantiacum]
MELTTVWFVVLAFLWTGYFFLEGFDFGVGALLPVLGRNDTERRVLINTIGPVWDGNEVWVVAAVGATFAAFPEWYATLLSAFYLPMLLILIALIVRALAFEYRGKRVDPAWQRRWDRCIVFGSVVPAFVWGFVFGNLLAGLPIDADNEFAGSVADLFTLAGLVGGLTTLTLSVLHGAVFLALKTTGDVRTRARTLAGRVLLGALVVTAVALVASDPEPITWATGAAALVALLAAGAANARGREGWAFLGTGAAIVLVSATLFVRLFPDVAPSSLADAYGLTTTNAAATPYTLSIMSWAALAFTPLVLLYQAWTYWVFRKRIGVNDLPPSAGAALASAAK